MSNVSFAVSAVARKDLGKADVRRLRRTGGVPGVIYGGKGEPVSITMKQNEISRHLQDEAFYSHILDLSVDGTEEQVILKDVQRHPFRQEIMHIDFLRIVKGQKLTVTVPLHFTNEDAAPGVKEGGVVQHVINEVEIEVLPRNLPEYLEVDMSAVEMNGHVSLSGINTGDDISIVSMMHGGEDLTVATVAMPRVAVEVEDDAAPEAADVPAANQKDED